MARFGQQKVRMFGSTALRLTGFLGYNFFRPHMALDDRTPAEAAGISLPFRNWEVFLKH